MAQRRMFFVTLGLAVILGLSCSLITPSNPPVEETQLVSNTPVPTEAAVPWSGDEYHHPDFSFSVPKGWSIHEGPSATGKNRFNYYRLDLTILVEASSKERLPKVTITTRDIPPGSNLEETFTATYAQISEEINHVNQTQGLLWDGQPALLMRYNRPWGEPWYTFQDAWVEANGHIYTVSCLWALDPSPEEEQGCATILNSLRFSLQATPVSTQSVPEQQAAQTVTPSSCPENLGKIVFAYDPMDLAGVHYGVYLMDANGENRIRLSGQEERNHSMPSWSPERCRIAYCSHTPDGDDDIFVMNADGTSIQRLTRDPARELFPDWSPDGSQIAYISYRDGFRNLYVMQADGGNPRQLTFNQKEFTQWLSWSPSGEYIAYTYNPEGNEIGESIHLIRPDGSGERQVTPPAGRMHDGEPTWSPDSQVIYFLSNRSAHMEIWSINLDGSGLTQISNLYAAGVAVDHSLRISPDGSRLIFYGAGGDPNNLTDLYTINVDGTGLTNLTRSSGKEEWVDW